MPVDIYALTYDEMVRDRRFRWATVENPPALSRWFARYAVDRMKENNTKGQWTCFALPVGVVNYRDFAELINVERVHCRRLALFLMNEYLDAEGRPVPTTHPLSVARAMDEQFVKVLQPDLAFDPNSLVLPNPQQLDLPAKRLAELGGIDVCFGQIGINGRFAYNDPLPIPDARAIDQLRKTTTRTVKLNEASVMQLAMTRTRGVFSVIPRFAATLGMKEILGAQRIVLLGMRSWHAGVVRRALFGPVSSDCPASLLQEHHEVTVVLTKDAAAVPAPREV